MKIIKKILIANRGEIAIRVMNTCQKMGIATVAVYSEADKDALFVKRADEALAIGGFQASESYLKWEKIIEAAKQTGADAIHPGYGFLSENSDFSKKCKEEGIIFIGPSEDAIISMGSKSRAKDIMLKAGVPCVPGYQGTDQSVEKFTAECDKIGYPVLIKSAAGGGGKGMRIVQKAADLAGAIEAAAREALSSFGDGTLLVEKYFDSAKHIEFQIFGDTHGNYTHFFERECSVQRRYQKVIEEAPSPSLTPELRAEMGNAAILAAKSVNYTNAGTVEFILDPKTQKFYFLEVNTRLQVEHPVTESITGLDLVRLQIEVAQGLPLKHTSENTQIKGHAIEARICAEDPDNNFFPATGNVLYWNEPALPDLRFDSAVETGGKVDVYYDSMISKVIVKAETRDEAIQKMCNALTKFPILGITTNKDFLIKILRHPAFVDGSFDTKFIATYFDNYKDDKVHDAAICNQLVIAAMLYRWNNRLQEAVYPTELNGWRSNFYQPQYEEFAIANVNYKVEYHHKGNGAFQVSIGEFNTTAQFINADANTLTCVIGNQKLTFALAETNTDMFMHHPEKGAFKVGLVPRFADSSDDAKGGGYKAPMPGEVVKVLVNVGDKITSGKGLLVMSSMKMETTIEAHADGIVEEIYVAEKNFVEADTVLLKITISEN